MVGVPYESSTANESLSLINYLSGNCLYPAKETQSFLIMTVARRDTIRKSPVIAVKSMRTPQRPRS